MAMTASELGTTELWALDDGPVWVAAHKFGIDVNLFTSKSRGTLVDRIRAAADSGEPTLLWVSKGLHPLETISQAVTKHPNITVIQDFDEDDLALMVQHVRGSLRGRWQYPPYNPRSPLRVRRAQTRAAAAADGFSFTSNAIRDTYRERSIGEKPSGRIPHMRSNHPREEVLKQDKRGSETGIVLAFLGSIRPHKGVAHIVRIAEAMPEARVVSFAQAWRPPHSLRDRWTELPSETGMFEAYQDVDILLVPQDLNNHIAQTQLSAKVLDAAIMARAVVGSPTLTLEEYAAGAYLPITDWLDTDQIVDRIRAANLEDLGIRLRDVFDEHFSAQATSDALRDLLSKIGQRTSS